MIGVQGLEGRRDGCQGEKSILGGGNSTCKVLGESRKATAILQGCEAGEAGCSQKDKNPACLTEVRELDPWRQKETKVPDLGQGP